MSIMTLTVYLLAVFGLSNLHITNGKSFSGMSGMSGMSGFSGMRKGKHFGSVHSGAPQAQFQPLDADWLTKLQGQDFHEVESDDGRGGKSHSGLETSTAESTTTASSLGFDFKYLFDKGAGSSKPSNGNNWANTQTGNNQQPGVKGGDSFKDNGLLDQFQQIFGNDNQGNTHQKGSFFDQNQRNQQGQQNHQTQLKGSFFDQNQQNHQSQLGFGLDNQGFQQQGGLQSFNPFAMPFQVPDFLNVGSRGYSSRNRRPPMFGGRGYSRGYGFPRPPPPQFFHGGFGAF